MEQPLRSGTLTLMFSDIEGSTRLLTQLRGHYGEALSVQRAIMREEISASSPSHPIMGVAAGERLVGVPRLFSAENSIGRSLAISWRMRSGSGMSFLEPVPSQILQLQLR